MSEIEIRLETEKNVQRISIDLFQQSIFCILKHFFSSFDEFVVFILKRGSELRNLCVHVTLQ